MQTRLAVRFAEVRSRYWFYPAGLGILAIALAIGMNRVDASLDLSRAPMRWINPSTPEGARAVLTTVATSAITVAGVVFSITMVVLNMASAQFGPRLLHNFMRHNATQVFLGTFVATTVYCLFVVTDVGAGEEEASLPHLALLTGMILALLSFAMLVYFFHHVTRFVRAPLVIDDAARRLEHRLVRSFPDRAAGPPPPRRAGPPVQTLTAPESGYVQAVDVERLVEIACARDVVFQVHCRAGRFVVAGAPLVDVFARGPLDDRDLGAVLDAIVLGAERTDDQDPEFSLTQLAEIALRALSPSLNDPFTALTCVDRIAGALALVVTRHPAAEVVCDADGCERVRVAPFSVPAVIHAGFDPLRRYAVEHPAVAARILEVIAELARRPIPPPVRAALREHVDGLGEASGQFLARRDRDLFDDRRRAALTALAAPT